MRRWVAVVLSAVGLIFLPWQTRAADYFLPLGPVPEPKAIEPHCVHGSVSRDAVRHVIVAAGYRLAPFLGPGDDVLSFVHQILDRGGGALLYYRPGVTTMVPRRGQSPNGHVRLSRRREIIVESAVGDGPGRWNGIAVKELYIHFAGVKGWFLANSSDLEAICTRKP